MAGTVGGRQQLDTARGLVSQMTLTPRYVTSYLGGSTLFNESSNGSGSTAGRDEHGRFLPGSAQPGAGRKPKAVERAYVDAVKEALPPDEIAHILTEALEMARNTNSWRGMVEVAQLALAYGAGKPMQKIVASDNSLETLLAALADDTGPLLPAPPLP